MLTLLIYSSILKNTRIDCVVIFYGVSAPCLAKRKGGFVLAFGIMLLFIKFREKRIAVHYHYTTRFCLFANPH